MIQALRLLEQVIEAGGLKLGDGALIKQYPESIFLEKVNRAIPAEYL